LFFVFICFILAGPIVAAMFHEARRALNAIKHEYLQLRENLVLKHSSIDFMHEVMLLISKKQSACCYKKKSLLIKYSRGRIKMYSL